jgi:hypothetical protein
MNRDGFTGTEHLPILHAHTHAKNESATTHVTGVDSHMSVETKLGAGLDGSAVSGDGARAVSAPTAVSSQPERAERTPSSAP